MRQGTTPLHTFTIPFIVPNGSVVRVIYSQGDKVLFVKTGRDVNVSDNEISIRLAQEDTFAFDHTKKAKIQIRIITPDEESFVSNVMAVSVEDCLENEVIRSGGNA